MHFVRISGGITGLCTNTNRMDSMEVHVVHVVCSAVSKAIRSVLTLYMVDFPPAAHHLKLPFTEPTLPLLNC